LGAWFTRGWFVNLAAGTLLGALTLGLAVLIAYLAGGLRFQVHISADVSSTISSLLFSITVLFIAAAFEEALFRGYILQTFARSGLAWFAIILTAIFFAAVHTANPNMGVISTINTAIAGIWFGVAYLRTRDLWFVTGLHFMWNWMQGAFFGIEISGLNDLVAAPLMREIDAGPAWLTGDTYGLEGGIAATVALIASTALILFLKWPKADPELMAMTSPPVS
nr:CPBP family intramembrane metalloprotease [Blastocatellia bacterium]